MLGPIVVTGYSRQTHGLVKTKHHVSDAADELEVCAKIYQEVKGKLEKVIEVSVPRCKGRSAYRIQGVEFKRYVDNAKETRHVQDRRAISMVDSTSEEFHDGRNRSAEQMQEKLDQYERALREGHVKRSKHPRARRDVVVEDPRDKYRYPAEGSPDPDDMLYHEQYTPHQCGFVELRGSTPHRVSFKIDERPEEEELAEFLASQKGEVPGYIAELPGDYPLDWHTPRSQYPGQKMYAARM